MNSKTLGLSALGAIIVVGAGVVLLRHTPPAPVASPPIAGAVAPVAAVSAPPAPAAAAPTDCLLPGPPPVPPDGYTATAADMKLAREAMQGFVNALEGYQNCRNSQADHTPGATEAQKDAWVSQGNGAIDEAKALAALYSRQLKIFKARPPGR